MQELVHELEESVTRESATEAELAQLEAELFVLGERIQLSHICDDLPEFVWHFLSDADIRLRNLSMQSISEKVLVLSLSKSNPCISLNHRIDHMLGKALII